MFFHLWRRDLPLEPQQLSSGFAKLETHNAVLNREGLPLALFAVEYACFDFLVEFSKWVEVAFLENQSKLLWPRLQVLNRDDFELALSEERLRYCLSAELFPRQWG